MSKDHGEGARPEGAARVVQPQVIRSSDLPLGEDSGTDETVRTVTDETVIRLLAEELAVDRRQVETGRLRLRVVTRERVEEVNETVERIEAEVERVPVGSLVDERPAVRETEDEFVIPIVEEVLVVERRLMLKEEVHVRKIKRTEPHHEQVTLRAQDIEVLRLPPRTPPKD